MKGAYGTRKITLECFVLALIIEEMFEYQDTIKEISFFPVICKNASDVFTAFKKLEFSFSPILDYYEIFSNAYKSFVSIKSLAY